MGSNSFDQQFSMNDADEEEREPSWAASIIISQYDGSNLSEQLQLR